MITFDYRLKLAILFSLLLILVILGSNDRGLTVNQTYPVGLKPAPKPGTYRDEDIEEKVHKGYKWVDQLPNFWLKDRPWHVGFTGTPCPETDFLVLIETAPKNLAYRIVLRQFFKRLKEDGIKFEHRFIFGQASDEINIELRNNDDVVFGDFTDSYANLPLKTKVAYEYLKSCKSTPRYFLVHDDDTWVNLPKMMKRMDEKDGANRIFGRIRKGEPRGPWAKEKDLAVNKTIWLPDYWPIWVAGPCTFMKGETAIILADTAERTNWEGIIPIEDVFFTGIVRLKAGLPNPYEVEDFNPEPTYFIHTENDIEKLKKKTGYTSKKP